MQLDLTQLGRHGRADEHLDRTYEAAAFTPQEGDEYTVASPVHLVVDVHKDRDAFRVTGRVQTTLRLECGRCLEPFTVPVGNVFDLRYLAEETGTAGTHEEREIREDDLATSYYRDDTLDLDELMREQFELALPMKPLCSEGCRGLCATCGTNLNTGTCECKPAWEDPRLATLKGLLDTSEPAPEGSPEDRERAAKWGAKEGPRRAKASNKET